MEISLPRVPGHEFGGEVVACGKEVTRFRPGDRVTVPFHLGCGKCEECWNGRYNLCLAYGIIGVHHDGGYGELVRVPNADATLVRLPEAVDAFTAAALGCRFTTAYHGVVDRAAVRPGEWVAVFGLGGVGLSVVQIASAIGARVIAVGRSDDKLAMARNEGAEATVKAGPNASAEVVEISKGGAAVTVDALGARETTISAILSLAKAGRHVQLGLTGVEDAGTIGIPMDLLVVKEIRIAGSLGCPTTSYGALLGMVASGKLKPSRLVEAAVSISEVNEVFTAMTGFQTRGFHVINNWKAAA
jgi:D-arabinose 1-dehydrogenase-like Zn-dependent alcohol dehydrogenase